MKIAVVLYPGLALLDVAGPSAILSAVPGVELAFVAEQRGPLRADCGRTIFATGTWEQTVTADVLLVPGTLKLQAALANAELHDFIRRLDQCSTWTTSVCTGSLLLAQAGLLRGRRATSHWLARSALANYGAVPVDERVVVDGKSMTAAGVTAGIDLGLTLVRHHFGEAAWRAALEAVDYGPNPPFDAGSTRTASLRTRLAATAALTVPNPIFFKLWWAGVRPFSSRSALSAPGAAAPGARRP